MTELAAFSREAARLGLAPDLDLVFVRDQLDRQGKETGIWVGLKANMAVEGQAWTAGIPGRDGENAPFDAVFVDRLRRAGCVLVPGLAMDEAAFGATGVNASHGRSANPLDNELVVGGSSGGSAAAVAAGLLPLALGSDTLGSVRIPAAYCGIMGLKPTAGLIGRSGVIPLSPSLDTVGILGTNPEELQGLLRIVAGFDPDDTASKPAPDGWSDAAKIHDLGDLRVGVPVPLDDVELEGPVREQFYGVKKALRNAGVEVVPVPMSGWSPSACRKAALLLVEAEGAVALSAYLDRPGGLSQPVASAMNYGRSLPSAKLVAALAEMKAASSACETALQFCDVLIMPTTPQHAFKYTETPPSNQADLTALANVSGLPAIAIPFESGDKTKPGSVQLIGPAWSDVTLLKLAGLLRHILP